mgnify:FL=1|tara:strand:- start:1381 stop:1851 length:471 start_codon:yes stop_codon:yes gene_type:complete
MVHYGDNDGNHHGMGSMGDITIDGAGRIPFYENPKIRESKKAGYNRTNIFKRSEPIRLWVGSTAKVIDVEIKYTLPHMAAMGASISSAIDAARKSVEPRGSKGPGIARLNIHGSAISFPPCIVTDYELDMPYDQGAFGHDSRVIILRLKLEEYHGV